MKSAIVSLLALCALTLASFGLAAAQETDNELTGTQWELVSFSVPDGETPVILGSTVTLEFQTAQDASGSGGCNSYATTYTVDGVMISFEEIISTKMACADEEVMRQETVYFVALGSANRYELADDRLTIWSEDGQQLNFSAVGALTLPGSQWSLESFGLSGEETPVIPGSEITLAFPTDSENTEDIVSGHAGCNGYGGNYTAEDGTISFNDIVSTLIACEDDQLMQQEQAYFGALQATGRFEISEGRLTIWYDGEQSQLNFVATGAYALRVTDWQLAEFVEEGDMVIPVVEESIVTLEFSGEDQAGGSGGCNTYGGTYTVEGDEITFSEVVSTLMVCIDNAIMEQEAKYLDALNTATRFEILDGELFIHYGEGNSLRFVPVSAPITPVTA